MRINKKRVFSSEEFLTFRNEALDKARNIISKDIDKLEKVDFKVRQFPVDFDNHILITERSSLSYDGIVPAIIELFLRNKSKKDAIRLEKNNTICAIELHVKSKKTNGKRCKKIIRYFVFRYKKSKGGYVVKDCNNEIYNAYVSSLIKKGEDYAYRDQIGVFLLRCLFPKRFGEQAYTFQGKDYTVFVFIAYFLLILLILTFIWLLRY